LNWSRAGAELRHDVVSKDPKIAVSGSFLATKDCPAFQSFRKATNPGAVKVEVVLEARGNFGIDGEFMIFPLGGCVTGGARSL
jgi:hypothetical protein